jgi:hypothetical protein
MKNKFEKLKVRTIGELIVIENKYGWDEAFELFEFEGDMLIKAIARSRAAEESAMDKTISEAVYRKNFLNNELSTIC